MKVCAECKKEYEDGVRFCPECGGKLAEQTETPVAAALSGVNVRDGVVVGGVHVNATDSRTYISHQDDTREVLTCAGCGAHVRKPNGFTCPLCNRFFCAADYDKDRKACSLCLELKATAAIREYGALLDELMRDGRIDAAERARLEDARSRLGLRVEDCEHLEKERRISKGAGAAHLGRRDQALLEDASQLLMGSLSFDEALKVAAPLFDRFPEHPEVRRIYLLALLEVQPERAEKVIEGLRFDDLDKSLAQIELLARRSAFDRGYEAVEEARRIFGADNPDLIACETDLTLEEYRITGRRALLDVAVDNLNRLPEESTAYAGFAHAFLRYMKGDKRPLAELEQAGNYFARRKKKFILDQANARITQARKQARPDPALKVENRAEVRAAPPPPRTETRVETPVAPQPPPPVSIPPPPQPLFLMPGLWQLTVVSAWGQSFYGTCQVTAAGPNMMLVADISGQALLWDGLLHFFQERSIFRGSLSGINLFATCGELVRMVDGMVVPVPGLPARLNAVIGDNGRSITGTVVNALGESTRIMLRI